MIIAYVIIVVPKAVDEYLHFLRTNLRAAPIASSVVFHW